MQASSARTGRVLFGGLAAAGIVIAHGIAYAFTNPDPHERLQHLASTGHGHWSFVVVAAIALLVGGLALYLSGVVRSRGPLDPPPFLGVLGRLAALQVTGFLALETSERWASGGLAGLFADPAVLSGLVLQILIAALGAAVLTLFTKGVVAALQRFRARRRYRRTVDAVRFVSSQQSSPSRVATGGGSVRGPPVPA